jgi:predicted nuclease with TOPRIM domain
MKDQITERLKTLQAEYDAGQKMLAELDARRASLTTTLLRIEGAIHVLKEMIDPAAAEPAGPNGASPGARPT